MRKNIFLPLGSLVLAILAIASPAHGASKIDGRVDQASKETIQLSGTNFAELHSTSALLNDPHYTNNPHLNLPQPTHHYASGIACTENHRTTDCTPTGCTTGDRQGIQYQLYQAPITENPPGIGTILDLTTNPAAANEWQAVGTYCSAALDEARNQILAQAISLTIEDIKDLDIAPSITHGPQFGGKTLIHYETNIWAEPQEQIIEAEVAGLPVEVRVVPVRFLFDYGDGTRVETKNPGYFLADDRWDVATPTSHRYTETGVFEAGVTTFYGAEFRVEGGPWVGVEGEAEVAGDSVLVDVWRTDTYLVEAPTGRR